MGASLGTASGPNADLNLTPLIDIVLVVLIIMMVNIPIQVEEMTVKLPSSKPQVDNRQEPPKDQLVVAMYENEELALNRKLMTEEVLLAELMRRLRPMAEKNVFVDAAATVPYGKVIRMVDLAREAGAEKVGLAKMKEAGPLEATSVASGALPRGIQVGSPKVVGAISEKRADEALQPLMGSIRSCYDQRLAVDPDLSGKLTLRVTVGPQGELLDPPRIQPGGTIEDEALRACIEGYLPNLTFQPLGEGNTALIHYALLFSPG